jgi:autotransporter translocation and assembly factor TamB
MKSKRLFISFLVVGLLFFAGITTLHSTRFHNYLLSRLRTASGWKISCENSEIGFFRGIIVLDGVTAEDPKGKIKIAADRFSINLSAFSLIRGKIIITDLDADRPTVHIAPAEKKEPPKPLPDLLPLIFAKLEKSRVLQHLIIEKIAVTDLNLFLPNGKTAFLKKAVFGIESNLLQQIEVKAHFENNADSGILPALNGLDIAVTLKKDGVLLKKLVLDHEKFHLDLKGEWKGNLEKGSLKAEGKMAMPLFLADPLEFSIDSKTVKSLATISKLEVKMGKVVLTAKGTVQTEKKFCDILFSTKDLPLEAIFAKLPAAVLNPAQGIAELEGKAVGTFPKVVVSAHAKIRDFKHGVLNAKEAEGTVQLDWPSLDWDANIKLEDGGRNVGHVKGGIAFKHLSGFKNLQAAPKTIDLHFDKAPLGKIVPTLNVDGNLDGDLHLQGVGVSLQGTGQATITDGHIFANPIESFSTDIAFHLGGKILFSKTLFKMPKTALIDWPGTVTLDTIGDSVLFTGTPMDGFSFKGSYEKESKVFRISSFQIHRNGYVLDGGASFPPDGKIEAKIKGTFNLDGLNYLASVFRETQGTSRVDLAFSGLLKDPSVRGTVEFPDLPNEINIRGFPREISNLKGKISLEGGTISPDISGLLGDGKFSLAGNLKLDQWKPVELNLIFHGSNLTFSRPNIYHLDFAADLTLKGRLPSPLLEGQIDIVNGQYTKPFIVRELVMKPAELPSEPGAWEKSLESLKLKLSVKNSGEIEIKNNVAEIQLLSNLQITGTYGSPHIEGAITTTDGTIHYLGKEFALTEGRLTFLNVGKNEPYLTLTAQQFIEPDYTVFIELKGYLDNLQVNLSSTPSLTREDIISLVAFGMTQEEIRQGGQKGSISNSILASEVSNVFEGPVSNATGLDIFRLEASQNGSLSVLSVGKNVTERLSVDFKSDMDPQASEKTLEANYYLTDNILLKGFRSQLAGTSPHYQFNISLRFRLQ